MLQSLALVCGAFTIAGQAQKPAEPSATTEPAPPPDPLGRGTPRGTVIGFLQASRVGDTERAARYLDARKPEAERLARQLFVVLDARLPARLMRISDRPEGSGNSLESGEDIVGTIGQHDIVLERVVRGGSPIWLFSRATLDAVPALHEEVVSHTKDVLLPAFLIETRIGAMRLVDLLALLLGLPALYLATVLLNRTLTALSRRLFSGLVAFDANVLPLPARLLLLTIATSILVASLPLSLAARQRWSSVAALLTSVTVAWLLILSTREVERHLRRRIAPFHTAAAASLLRLLRHAADVLIVFGVGIATLRRFGIDPTPALAGLGVGGIAVALAAQKTLENVIAGASLIFDKAVQVGDFLKMGDTIGTVDHIGLRSTRIRTLDRTVVSVPNSQIANASLETLSARDKFWFHPVIGLGFDTTREQLHRVLEDVRRLLCDQPRVEPESIRVRFFRLGTMSLDIEVFAYLRASDWNHFLELQERLLSDVTGIVSQAGASLARPVQVLSADKPLAPDPSLPTF
jgi:MscS family membrane protein